MPASRPLPSPRATAGNQLRRGAGPLRGESAGELLFDASGQRPCAHRFADRLEQRAQVRDQGFAVERRRAPPVPRLQESHGMREQLRQRVPIDDRPDVLDLEDRRIRLKGLQLDDAEQLQEEKRHRRRRCEARRRQQVRQPRHQLGLDVRLIEVVAGCGQARHDSAEMRKRLVEFDEQLREPLREDGFTSVAAQGFLNALDALHDSREIELCQSDVRHARRQVPAERREERARTTVRAGDGADNLKQLRDVVREAIDRAWHHGISGSPDTAARNRRFREALGAGVPEPDVP
jgi:hypothetical protein